MVRTLCCCLLVLAAAGPVSAEDGWWGGLSQGQHVNIEDVLANPHAHQGKTLSCAAIFHKLDRYYDPLRSGLNAKRYQNFALWPDGVALWEDEGYLKTYPFFYLPRSHHQRADLMRLERFTRIQLTMRLRASIRGKPAFEVLSFRKTGHRLGERVVRQMMDGDKRARRGDLRVAARRYREVLASHPDLPPVYDLKIRKRLADALREMGHPDKAARVEGGAPIEGSTALPRTRDDPFQPDAARGPLRGDATGSPDGAAGAGDATGSPDGWGAPPASGGDATGSPDGAGPSPADPPPDWSAPPPDGAGDVLPGEPYGVAPPPGSGGRVPRRLPGLGDPGERPRAAMPPRSTAPVRLPPGIPPKRTPRLSGVK